MNRTEIKQALSLFWIAFIIATLTVFGFWLSELILSDDVSMGVVRLSAVFLLAVILITASNISSFIQLIKRFYF